MAERMIRLLVPTAETAVAEADLQARPSRLSRIAFLHNGQPHYDMIAPQLVALLKARPHLALREYRKPSYGRPAEAEVLEEIAAGSQAAVVGLAC